MGPGHRAAAPLTILLALAFVSACDIAGEASGQPATASAAVTPRPTPLLTEPAPTPEPTFLVYRVRSNDALLAIAKRFRTTADSIGYWNRDRYPTLDPDSAAYRPGSIGIGWLLRIHPGQTTDGDDGAPTESPAGSDPGTVPEGSSSPAPSE